MASLSDKLRALGVQVGTQGLPSTPPGSQPASQPDSGDLAARLGGHPHPTPLGETFLVEHHYPLGAPHGAARLALRPTRRSLAAWAGDERLADLPAEAFAFIDTETTGLSGGTGTLAFLIGAGRFIGDEFYLAQFFLRDPVEEPGQLAALEVFLAPCQAIVSFNGKAFDAPLLLTRYTAHGWKPPLHGLAHVDLLHLARRLWRDRLPSRTLGNLEVQILGAARTQDDIPGWDIPRIYQEYLRTGSLDEMSRVMYHNAMDVLSLAALMDHMAGLLDDPLSLGGRFGVDVLALARLFEDLGQTGQAAELYLSGLDHEDAHQGRVPRPLLLQAILRLAALYKRQGQWPAAIHLWEQAAGRGCLDACVELAKCYEHSLREPSAAQRWTQTALQMVQAASPRPKDETYLPLYERRRWQQDLEHRLARLEKTLYKPGPPPTNPQGQE